MRYEIYSFADKNSAFWISSVGYSGDIRVTRYGPAVRNNYIIHYVLSGQGYFNNQIVKAGQGFLITPQMFEHYCADENKPWEFVWIIFENDLHTDKIFKEYNANPETGIFEYSNITLLSQMKNHIMKNNNKILSGAELYEMFLHIFNRHRIAGKRIINAEEMYCSHAIKFINSNLSRKITVDELVGILGVSQPYLYNIFKKNMSVSPKQYIDMKKEEKAKELLTKTSMSLTQIANSVGMDDCITFSKFFKKRVGVSPSDFRKTGN